jgi:hypothetical protein
MEDDHPGLSPQNSLQFPLALFKRAPDMVKSTANYPSSITQAQLSSWCKH